MTVVLEEFAEAPVDTDWLARAIGLIDREPVDAAEAVSLLRAAPAPSRPWPPGGCS